MSARNMAKRTAAGTLALAVCLGGGAIALASAASADANFKFDRIAAGTDRFDTAIQSSKTAFPSAGQAGGVVLVNGWRSVDGLTASSLAGAYQASILYSETDAVPQATRDEINRLGTKNIWLVGGTTVLSSKLEADLKSAGFTVNRVGGSDRFETAAKVSDATMTKTGKKPGHVFVASGVDGNLSDSTVLAPLAYSTGSPILLSEPGDAPKYTTDQLDDVKGAEIHVVGGKSALTDAVYNEVGAKDRIAGADRGETANYVSDFAKKVFGFSTANAALVGAKNSNVADSLAAAAFLGNAKTTIHYAGLDSTNQYFKDHAAELSGKGWIIGGKDVVTDAQVAAATAAAQTVTAAAQWGITSDDAVVNSVTGTRTYTVTGLTAGQKVRIELLSPTVIDGKSFSLSTDKRTALATPASNATVTHINNVALAAGAAQVDYTPDGTSLTFKVTASAATELIPVVYSNADSSNKLDVNLAGTAKGAAAIGGKVKFQAAAATAPAESADVTVVPASNDTVATVWGTTGFQLTTASTGQRMLRDSDIYKLGGNTITKAQFLSILSPGDTIEKSLYTKEPASGTSNTFNIVTDAVPTALTIAPTGTPSTTTLGLVKVSFMSDTEFAAGSTSYELQRREVSAAATPVGGASGQWTTINTRTVTVSGEQTFSETLAAGKYEYRVRAVSPSFSGTAAVESAASSLVTVTTTAATAAPDLQRLYLTSNATDINNLSAGDSFKIVLTQPINAPVAGATLTVGAQLITNVAATSSTTAGDANFSVNTSAEVVDGVSQSAGKVLTVKLLANPVGGVQAFGTGGIAFTASSGIGNSVGSLPAPAGANNVLTRDVVS